MESARDKYALVEWVSGEDAGKLSVVDSSWIRDFDGDLDFDETYIVEWRAGKESNHGWPVFDAKLIGSSNSKKKLEAMLQDMALAKFTSPPKGKRSATESPPCTSTEKKKKPARTEPVTEPIDEPTYRTPQANNSWDLVKINQEKIISMLEKANLPEMKKKIDKIYRNLKTNAHNLADLEEEGSGESSRGVEIFPDTDVHVPRTVWELARKSSSGTAFARTLLVNLIDGKTLLESNYGGGASKTSKEPPEEKHKKLDEKIMSALKAAAIKHDPTMKVGDFGKAMNGKCNELRSNQKNR